MIPKEFSSRCFLGGGEKKGGGRKFSIRVIRIGLIVNLENFLREHTSIGRLDFIITMILVNETL